MQAARLPAPLHPDCVAREWAAFLALHAQCGDGSEDYVAVEIPKSGRARVIAWQCNKRSVRESFLDTSQLEEILYISTVVPEFAPGKLHRKMASIPTIDLFAGPGGLNHGFASHNRTSIRFDIRLSIEKDPLAHQTLVLRAFTRQFKEHSLPEEYYQYITGRIGKDRLVASYPGKWSKAESEVRQWELGSSKLPFKDVYERIASKLCGARHWILLGGPPCQAYSLAGRSRMKNLSGFATDHRHTLYREYLKIVATHQPAVFVMENVKGILSSIHGSREKSDPIIVQILQDLADPAAALKGDKEITNLLPRTAHRYKIHSFVCPSSPSVALEPEDFVIKSEQWGIPQARHRVILLGVRDDLNVNPKTLGQFWSPERTTVEEVIGGLPKLRSKLSQRRTTSRNRIKKLGKLDIGNDSEKWTKAIAGVRRKGIFGRLSGGEIGDEIDRNLRRLSGSRSTGTHFVEGEFKPKKLTAWLWDRSLNGVIQHEARAHMPSDLRRYFFAACAAKARGVSPKLSDFPTALLPRHKNIRLKGIRRRNTKNDFADRFRVQVKLRPSTTITSHISKDGHYYIHYDPLQCRSLTVREAARLQTFPDSYFFEGNRTQQYYQIGNAVPPLLASKLADVVAAIFLQAARPTKHSVNSLAESVA